MPWLEISKMESLREFVNLAVKPGCNMSELCRRYGISRKIGYKWKKRYEEYGEEGLHDLSTRPKSSPKRTNKDIEEAVISARLEHPYWGGRTLKKYLENQGHDSIPSASTVSKIISRNGLINSDKPRQNKFIRFEHESSNDLWQMDFKGHFAMKEGRCHPLTILDDHSRFCICLEACDNERGTTVLPIMEKVFSKYGLPECINVDNGSPWGSPLSRKHYTKFAVWLMEIGVIVSHSRPYHPQTNGKDERFHRTLNQELIKRSHFNDLGDAQSKLDNWREQYNNVRPHQAIDMMTPSQRYTSSYRKYMGPIKSYDYPDDMIVRKADINGRFFVNGNRFRVGKAFAYKYIGIRQNNERVLNCYYLNTNVKNIDLFKDRC